MQPEIREIEVATDQGMKPVRAGVYGLVAVHVPVIFAGSVDVTQRVVTHVATGKLILGSLYRDVAIRIAEQIGGDAEWGFCNNAEFEQRRASLSRKLDAALKAATKGGKAPER